MFVFVLPVRCLRLPFVHELSPEEADDDMLAVSVWARAHLLTNVKCMLDLEFISGNVSEPVYIKQWKLKPSWHAAWNRFKLTEGMLPGEW